MMHGISTSRLQIASTLLAGLVLCIVTTWPAEAAWVALGQEAPGTVPEIVIERRAPRIVDVDIVVAGIDVNPVTIDGITYSRVTMPGCVPGIEVGHPELPILARAVAIPGVGAPRLEILEEVWQNVAAHPPVPSRGALTRDVDLDAAPYVFSEVYAQNGVWPAEFCELGRPFLVRDRRGVTLRVHPVRWNAGSGHLEALVRLRVRIVIEGDGGANTILTPPRPAGRSFAPVMNAVFGDRSTTKAADPDSEEMAGQDTTERLLIVTHASLKTAVADLVSWKQERGYVVEVLDVDDLGGAAEGIHAVVHQRYHASEGLAHLLLVGDATLVPTNTGTYHGAASDGMFGLVSGDDLFVDVLVSRLPARTAAELSLMTTRSVIYERNPQSNGSWYNKAAGIASDEGRPTDYERADALRGDMLAGGFTQVAQIYQSLGGSRTAIAAAVNEGASLINYLGHGSGTGWLSVPFNTSDVHQLTNTTAWPWIIDVACHNGDFVRPQGECFAEAWLRAQHGGQPAGAVAVIAASSLASWVPPTVMQETIIDRLMNEGQVQIGALLAAGVAEVLVRYQGTQEGRKLMEQYNLFGDGTLQVRSRRPDPLVVSHPANLEAGRPELTLALPAGARAVLTDRTGVLARADQIGSDPVLLIPSRDLVLGEVIRLTVTASNSMTYRVALPVGASIDPGEIVPVLARSFENWPNPFNPQTTVGFVLAEAGPVRVGVHDARGRLVRVLIEEHLPAGNHHVLWDGRDGDGRDVASGVYLARLLTTGGERVHKMTLAR